jgi:hypothetical protein
MRMVSVAVHSDGISFNASLVNEEAAASLKNLHESILYP